MIVSNAMSGRLGAGLLLNELLLHVAQLFL
jgi:hypothetical protein